MGGSSSTSANIPTEYKGLSSQTGNLMSGVQKYLWGSPTMYGNPTPNLGTGSPAGGGARGATGTSVSTGTAPAATGATGTDGLNGTNQAGLQWLGSHPGQVAGANDLMTAGNTQAGNITGAANPYNAQANAALNAALGTASKAPTVDVNTDPSIKAAFEAFNKQALPQLQNQAELSGLGHSSSLNNSVANAQGQMLVPLISDAFGRAAQNQATQIAAQNALANQYSQQGANATNATTTAANTLYGQGADTRTNVSQAALDKQAQDYANQQAFAQQMLTGPMSGFLPSTIGSTTKGK